MHTKLENAWKEAVVLFKILSGICLKGLKKTTKNLRLVGIPAEIWPRDFRIQNRSAKHAVVSYSVVDGSGLLANELSIAPTSNQPYFCRRAAILNYGLYISFLY